MAVINEFSDKLSVYMTNYRTDDTSLKTDTLKIYGCISEPSYSFTDRASHKASNIKSEWKDGIFTLYVSHNGPLHVYFLDCLG